MEEHQRAVYGLAIDLTGNRHDAEDLMQDTFLKAYRSLEQFRGVDGQRRTWLYRIATTTYLNTRRKKALTAMQLRPDMTTDGLAHGEHAASARPLSPPQAAAPDAAEQRQVNEHVERALALLSPRERTAFVLRHYHDQSIREVAASLDIAEGTVKSLLFRATRKLRDALSFYRADLGLSSS